VVSSEACVDAAVTVTGVSEASVDISEQVQSLYRTYGPPKQMGTGSSEETEPHFFLHRSFLGEQDLAILFNTKRCRYQCKFCALPAKSSRTWIGAESVLRQFQHVITELRHSLGILHRLTIANEGSVLDATTFPRESLTDIVASTSNLPAMRKIVLESRLEFAEVQFLRMLSVRSGKRLDVLTGFETLDTDIRDRILGKREPVALFLSGLDAVARAGADLTAYVLFKPDPEMTDGDAVVEADRTMRFLRAECEQRDVRLTIRLNPMYVARGTDWARRAARLPAYRPPNLDDVVGLATRHSAEGLPVYVGLTSEGLSERADTYRGRPEFSTRTLKAAIVSNTSPSLR
jgi:radical SAM enzyme (TIGR01210 family)